MKNKINFSKKYIDIQTIINKRYLTLTIIIIVLMLILFLNLFYIQIVNHTYYDKKLESLTETVIEGSTAPRGRIYDRNHKLIVDNMPVKVITYTKSRNSSKKELEIASKLANNIEIDFSNLTDIELRKYWIKTNYDESKQLITEDEYQKLEERKLTSKDIEQFKIERVTEEEFNKLTDLDKEIAKIYFLMNEGYSYSEKIIKKDNVTDEEYAFIATNISDLDGVDIKLDWDRTYLYGDTFKSILGSVSSIPADLKEKYLSAGYNISDRVGTSYLEQQYDNYLKGEKNKYKLNLGNELELVSEGHRGNDIVLTIDIELQKVIEEIIVNELIKTKKEPYTDYYNRSFVLISNPLTGEILAMAGKQIIEKDGEYKIYDYTPGILTSPVVVGSIIKGASHIVGYNTGALKIGETRYDSCVKLRGAPMKCSWKSLGLLDDITALKQSSNTYQFYTALKVAGVNYFYDMPFNPSSDAFNTYRNTFAEFGLGVKTGIDLPFEIEGYKGKNEKGGLLLDFAIGQYDNYTPIQLMQYISTIANNGTRLQPYLLKDVYSYDSNLTKKIYESKVIELNKVNTEQIYLDRVKEGFKAVLNYGGTGSGYIDKTYLPAGKTGTSQSFVDTDNDNIIDTETITNTFAAYAPYNNPKVAFVVISPDISIADTSYQSNVNKRISKEISKKYFEFYN